MAKVHPAQASTLSDESDPCSTMSNSAGIRETFTIWMKSLVCHTNGCTVFDSNGDIVYRVENYDTKGSSEVQLMDLHGTVLFTILKKKLQICGRWNGYRGNFTGKNMKGKKPCFQVKKNCSIFRRSDNNIACEVTVGFNKFWIVRLLGGKKLQGFKIVNFNGETVAEVKQKQLSSGMVLGDDVLSLEIEPYIDHSLIVALVIVYGLINRKL
ncbi:Initiation factor 2B-related protein [Corchorus capsularis]|uniref:Initiation factor 2B-related protein n=1 Tax=Corchorus capsularis TaxID=210143 RepID=A0A1R3IA87_COCAP|nr:Initiation factor 2B-related protein [Corchorus capsularis]